VYFTFEVNLKVKEIFTIQGGGNRTIFGNFVAHVYMMTHKDDRYITMFSNLSGVMLVCYILSSLHILCISPVKLYCTRIIHVTQPLTYSLNYISLSVLSVLRS